jgi:hypothetical protein
MTSLDRYDAAPSRMSGATKRARYPACMVISLISVEASSRKSAIWIGSGRVRACSTFDAALERSTDGHVLTTAVAP